MSTFLPFSLPLLLHREQYTLRVGKGAVYDATSTRGYFYTIDRTMASAIDSFFFNSLVLYH